MRRLFYCDHYAIPLPPGHKFPMSKYRLIRDLLAQDGFYRFECAPLADAGTVALAHDPAYVQNFISGTLPPAAVRRIGFPWSDGLVKRTLASVGGTLACDSRRLRARLGRQSRGRHPSRLPRRRLGLLRLQRHRHRHPMAAPPPRRKARGHPRPRCPPGRRHRPDLQDDPDVLTISMHCQSNFPLRKQRSKIDVDLCDRIGDEQYLQALDQVLPQIFAFEPEIVYYQSGVDALYSDTLGKLDLTHQGLKERDRRVMAAVSAHQIPFVITLGGGYSLPIELTAEAHANTFRTAREVFN